MQPRQRVPLPVRVRRLGPADWRSYRELRLEMLLDAPEAFWSTHAELVGLDEQAWRLRSTSSTFQARTPDDVPVGTLTVLPPRSLEAGLRWDDVLLLAVYVRPAARGRGVLDAMVEAALPVARDDLGASRLVLHVLEDNARARAAYRRLGFTETGESIAHPRLPLVDVEMAREL